jgi:hypothetical protein
MSPETAIELVRSFIRWNSEKLERLDSTHEAIVNPLGWRRGSEYWLPSPTWHQIFENDEDAALVGAQALRDNGLLRLQTGPSLQCSVKIRNSVKRCYCVSEKIQAWTHSSKSYKPATNKRANGLDKGRGV